MQILLADNHIDIRAGLKVLLEHEGIDVVGEAAGIDELLDLLQSFRPEILLLDWEFPNLQPADIINKAKSKCPGLKIIALSVRPESRNSAIASGADAFVSKGDQPQRLLETINNIYIKGDERCVQ